MIFLKLYYHINAFFAKILYKIIYKKSVHFGRKVTFRKPFSLVIEDRGKIDIGDNVFFNKFCSVCSRNSIEIGAGTIVGENVKIYDHNHIYKDVSIPIKKQGYNSAPIRIGKHCWVGSNVVILKGVTIGNNVTIGAGCIIYKDISAGTTVICSQNLNIVVSKKVYASSF